MNHARAHRNNVVVASALVLALASAPAVAGNATSVDRLVVDGKLDAAQTRCERWEAWDPEEDEDVRQSCAMAFWPAADSVDTRAGWAAFRGQWTGTEASARARSREAAAALRELPSDANETVLLDLGEIYRGTPTADKLERRAADAAIRDARTPQAAVEAARRWAGHPDLPSLVERFPAAFITMTVSGRRVQWTVDPPVDLTARGNVSVEWVAHQADGTTMVWDKAVRELLTDWGVPESTASALPIGDDGPALPVCWMPDQPPGWRAGVELSVGDGRLFQPVEWDEGCGPKHVPVFVSLESARVVGLSLRPGHLIDLRSSTQPDGRRNTRGYINAPPGTPLLWNGWIHERVGSAWLITPLSGGTPWASVSGPDATAVPLGKGLRSGPLPAGWTVDGRTQPPTAHGAALQRMPKALRTWSLVPGEVRAPPPLVREVIGLTADRARPARSPAPALSAAGWNRTPTGSIIRTPPSGGSVAGIYQLEQPDIDQALRAAQGVGLPRSAIVVLDAWRADLDGDGIAERFVRATIDGDGALLIVDPLRKSFENPSQARVFVIEVPRVQADNRPADTPFTFRKGDFVYMAWGGQEVIDASKRRSFVQIVRHDGASFVLDDVELP